ncbi:MAG: hypothetical protein K5751_12315 [Treponemataceae bacterium]|nr:hypothetical protein [Treponemataceae bacterium]
MVITLRSRRVPLDESIDERSEEFRSEASSHFLSAKGDGVSNVKFKINIQKL